MRRASTTFHPGRTLFVFLIGAVACLFPRVIHGEESPSFHRFFLEYAVVRHTLKADEGNFDELMQLVEFHQQAANHIADFWWAKAHRECREFVESIASRYAKQITRKTTQGEKDKLFEATKEEADHCFRNVYYDHWDAINTMIRARLHVAQLESAGTAEQAEIPAENDEAARRNEEQLVEVEAERGVIGYVARLGGNVVDQLDFWKLVTILIGAFVAYVTYQQSRTARAKFKLDLFEKRFQVFASARRLLTKILQKANTDLDALFEFRAGVAEASFVFSADITTYLDEIDRRALHLHTLHEQMNPLPAGEERTALASAESQELEWLTGQLPELKNRFSPYMEFSRWRG